MKVLLVNPAGSDAFAKLGAQMPPLSLGYLAAFARKEHHDVKILDLGVERRKINDQDLYEVDLVGITTDTPKYFGALEIAKLCKEHAITVVMGGYHATFMDEEILKTGIVDFIVRGEGELIFTELLKVLEKGAKPQDLAQVDGISYLDNSSYKRNKTAKLPDNLDDFPFPARDLFNLGKYKNRLAERPLINMITSRGCPYDCHFCSSTKFAGKKWRYRSAKSIVDEIELLYHEYGYKAFTFLDDNFTVNKSRVMEFADLLEARGLNDIFWWCFSRVDIIVNNEDMIKRMADVGAFKIFVGLESASEHSLESYGKKINLNQQVKAFEILRKYGIRVFGSFILGDVHETEEMINNTVDWAIKLDPVTVQFSLLTPYPGTELYKKYDRENRLLHKQWDLYDALHSVVKMDYLSPEEMERLFYKSYRRFYLRYDRLTGKSKVTKTKRNRLTFKQNVSWSKVMRPISNFLIMKSLIRRNDTAKAIKAVGAV